MSYRVALYCPDRHIQYNLNTLDKQGVGGGITARIRMAHALAEYGHDVSLYVNCPEIETIKKVRYYHCDQLNKIDTDIFIVSTSGDGLDLSQLLTKKIDARLRVLMVHGVDPPIGFEPARFDIIYALSNFLRKIIIERWGIGEKKVFVSHRGVKSDLYGSPLGQAPKRNQFGIIYTGHPSKGLESALAVVHLLRRHDKRFSLHIFGGHQLWGGEERAIEEEPGVFYHGLIGQRELAQQMQKYGFSLNLQAREEPFGMVLIEAMKAGCIVIASRTGAFPEIIQHGQTGFLVDGHHTDAATRLVASELILELISQTDYCNSIRANATAYPLDWNTIAEAWSEHWGWVLGKQQYEPVLHIGGKCRNCTGRLLSLADGHHCIGCGEYQRHI